MKLAWLDSLQCIKVHKNIITDTLGKKGHQGSSRNDSQQVVPTASHPTTMSLNELLQKNAHLLFHHAPLVHMSRHTEQFGTWVVFVAKPCKPLRSPWENCSCNSNHFDIGDCCWASIKTSICRKGRLQLRLALLPLKTLQQCCLLYTDVCPHAPSHPWMWTSKA